MSCVVQAGFKLVIFLPQPPEHLDSGLATIADFFYFEEITTEEQVAFITLFDIVHICTYG